MAKKVKKRTPLGGKNDVQVVGVVLDQAGIDNLNVCGAILEQIDPSYVPGDEDDVIGRALAYFRGHLEEVKEREVRKEKK